MAFNLLSSSSVWSERHTKSGMGCFFPGKPWGSLGMPVLLSRQNLWWPGGLCLLLGDMCWERSASCAPHAGQQPGCCPPLAQDHQIVMGMPWSFLGDALEVLGPFCEECPPAASTPRGLLEREGWNLTAALQSEAWTVEVAVPWTEFSDVRRTRSPHFAAYQHSSRSRGRWADQCGTNPVEAWSKLASSRACRSRRSYPWDYLWILLEDVI